MKQRQTLIIVIGIPAALTLVLMSAALVFKIDRTILGFPPIPADSSAKDSIVPFILITEEKLKEIDWDPIERSRLYAERDSLSAQKKRLLDSIKKNSIQFSSVEDSLSKTLKQLEDSRKSGVALNDSIARLSAGLAKARNKIKLDSQRIIRQEELIDTKLDTTAIHNLEKFAKIYENSAPKEVAKILEQIDERDAALILKYMKKKKAGKVIDVMAPETAAAILLLGIE